MGSDPATSWRRPPPPEGDTAPPSLPKRAPAALGRGADPSLGHSRVTSSRGILGGSSPRPLPGEGAVRGTPELGVWSWLGSLAGLCSGSAAGMELTQQSGRLGQREGVGLGAAQGARSPHLAKPNLWDQAVAPSTGQRFAGEDAKEKSPFPAGVKDEWSAKVLQRGGEQKAPAQGACVKLGRGCSPRSQPPALPHLPCSEGEILKSFHSIKPCGGCQLNGEIARTPALPSPKADPSFKVFARVWQEEAEAAGEGLGGGEHPARWVLGGQILPGGAGAGQC